MVNQLRNAFAHNPWRPKWLVRSKYRAVHPVSLGGKRLLDFDATALDGKGIKPEDIGGLEAWVKVMKFYEGVVPA